MTDEQWDRLPPEAKKTAENLGRIGVRVARRKLARAKAEQEADKQTARLT